MSVTVEEPQRGPEEPSKLRDTAKETSEQEPDNVDNNADVKKATEPTQYGQNDKRDRGAPRIVMAYIPASAPASPIPSHNTPAPGRKTPEASNGGGRPVTPNLTAKLNQAIHEYRAREERVGDLGQPDDEGYEGDTNSPGAHQGCCDHDHEHYHVAHRDEQYSPVYQQQYCNGHTPPFNAPWGWTPYHPAFSPPLNMQPPFRPPFQHQQQNYANPHHQPTTPSTYHPPSFPFPYHPHPYHFPHPYQPMHHHQHFSIPPPPPPHLFAPPPPTHPSDPRISPPHFHPVSPYASSLPAYPTPFPPQNFQHPQPQDPHVTELTQRLQNIQAQLNGLDAAHEVEIWRHGKYNFHRRRAKQLRKIKREKVEEMVTVVRELRALGVSGGQFGGRQYPLHMQPQGQQETQGMCWTPRGSGYGAEFEQGWGYGQETGYWPGYGHEHEHSWFGEGHGHGQAGSWSEMEQDGGRCGCSDDGAYVDSPRERDSAFESMACECGCTTIDGEAGPEGESSEALPPPSPASSKQTSTGITAGDVVTPGGTRARALSLDGMREQVEAVESHGQQHGDANENEQGESVEKNSSRERAGSWSDAEAVISEELRGIWRKKMSE